MHAPEDRRVAQFAPAAKTAGERLLEQGGLVDVREHLGDRLARDVARDPERFNLACTRARPRC